MHGNGMESLINEWEIQLLVLLSFTLQLFLLFAGILRSRGYRGFLRIFIWIAYLGADSVAVYALGLLSRHKKNVSTIRRTSQPLAFFWAPFLLIHLGGQDTISAFSIEDNNLWLRHLLNLGVQLVLAFHVFWRSIGRHGVGLIVSGVLVFVAGIIKYGERTWCLKHGRLKDLESSTRNMTQSTEEIDADDAGGYSRTVLEALGTMPFVLTIFSASGYSDTNSLYGPEDGNRMVKMGSLHLGLMYDELYTKALVLRTRSFMILRHISQISAVVAFAIFHAIVDKEMYLRADVAITYSLFIGGFFLEVCSMLNFIMSPWTWLMLKGRKWERFASLSWFIFSSDIGWPGKKQRWPSSIGQYNFPSWATSRDRPRTSTFGQRVMAVFRRVFVDLVGAKEEKIMWMSKVLDTWYVHADEMTLECVAKEIILLDDELNCGPTREWTGLSWLLKRLQSELYGDFAYAVVHMHILTELHLSKYPFLPSDMAAADGVDLGMVQVCRKLSNYMMYLLVAHPSMLPITTSSAGLLRSCQTRLDMASEIAREMDEYDLQPVKETVEEMVYMWTRLLLYAAGKSRKEMHAAQLTNTGGELITFAWLLMAFYRLGDSQVRRVHIINTAHQDSARKAVYAFNIIARTRSEHAAQPQAEEQYVGAEPVYEEEQDQGHFAEQDCNEEVYAEEEYTDDYAA